MKRFASLTILPRRESCPERETFPVSLGVMGVLLLIALCLFRSWQTLRVPGLYMEDSVLFSYFYGHFRPLTSIFASHVGQNYLTVPPYFAAWVFSWFDVRLQPFLYQWWGFAWAVLACSVIFFSGLFQNRWILLLGPSVLGLLGLNDILYWNTLIYTMYTGLLVLFSLLFYPPPQTRTGQLVMTLCFLVLPWSGPYCVLLIPAGLLHAVFFANRRKNFIIFVGLCSTIAYFFTVQSKTTRLDQLNAWVIQQYLEVLLNKVAFLGLIEQCPLYCVIFPLFLLGITWFFFRGDRCYPRCSLLMLCLITASLSLFFLSVKFPLYGHTLACHRVVSIFFWLILLLYAADRFFVLYAPRSATKLLVVSCFVLLVGAANIRFPTLGAISPVTDSRDFTRAIFWCEQHLSRQGGTYIELRLPTPYQIMQPHVRIGSRQPDARPMRAVEFPNPSWRQYTVHE